METNWNYFAFTLSGIFVLWKIIQSALLKNDKLTSVKIWSLVFQIAFLISLLTLNFKSLFVGIVDSDFLLRVLVGLQALLLLAIESIVIIEKVTIKKVKTLWRLPLIGALLGAYLDLRYLLVVFVGVELFSLILFFRSSIKNHFYYKNKFIKLSILFVFILLCSFGHFSSIVSLFLIMLFYCYNMKIHNMVATRLWVLRLKDK